MISGGGAEGACLGTAPHHEGLVDLALPHRRPRLAHQLSVAALVVLDSTSVARDGAVDMHEARVAQALSFHGPTAARHAVVSAFQSFCVGRGDNQQADREGQNDP